MKRNIVTIGVALLLVGGLVVINQFDPGRRLVKQQEEEAEALKAVEAAQELAKLGTQKAIAEAFAKENEQLKEPGVGAVASEQDAPEEDAENSDADSAGAFKVKFECTNGDFVIECYPEWAPLGVARFREIIEAKLYDECRFFRVIPNFVVQWGINGDPKVSAKWENDTIKGEPVKTTNAPGTITYAMSGSPDSRTTQVFINFVDNARLDGMGFAPFGKVIEGMDVVNNIYDRYGQTADQGLLQSQGNKYLSEKFPQMDYIKTARIVE